MNKAGLLVKHINKNYVVKVGRKGVGYTEVTHPYYFDYSCSPVEDKVTNFESSIPKVVDLVSIYESKSVKDDESVVTSEPFTDAESCDDVLLPSLILVLQFFKNL